VAIEDARRMADEAGLDLVEVAPQARPPVCKLMDFGKFKYEQQKASRKGRKKQHAQELKRLRMRPKIDKHDLEVKMKKAREFLEEGHKVQIQMLFRGRELSHLDLGQQRLLEFAQEVEDLGKIERSPMREGRQMIMIIAPKPGGASKPASAKPPAPKKAAPPTTDRPASSPPTSSSGSASSADPEGEESSSSES